MDATLRSASGGSELNITVHGWEFPDERTGIDAEWLVVSLKYSGPVFSASIIETPKLTIGELIRLNEMISRIMEKGSGEFKLHTLEQISFEVSVDRHGVGSISGEIADVDTHSGRLHFEFAIDQSCLRIFSEQLASVISGYKR